MHDPSPAVWDNIQQAIRHDKPEPPATAPAEINGFSGLVRFI